MMSVLEYAEDVNKSVDEILKKCKELNIDVHTEEDMLDDEAITILDNNLDASEEEIIDGIYYIKKGAKRKIKKYIIKFILFIIYLIKN